MHLYVCLSLVPALKQWINACMDGWVGEGMASLIYLSPLGLVIREGVLMLTDSPVLVNPRTITLTWWYAQKPGSEGE